MKEKLRDKFLHLFNSEKSESRQDEPGDREFAADLALFDMPSIGASQATEEKKQKISEFEFEKVTPLPEAVLPQTAPEDIALRVRSLYKYYQTGNSVVKALDGVSFDVKRGEFCAIVGTSGSGKSTLLNMLAGLEPATAGMVKVFDADISHMSEAELVRFRLDNVGFVFQSFNLVKTLTALENVALPLMFKGISLRKRDKAAKAVLTQLGLATHLKHLPNELSGGQQQRIGIARALIVNPKVIFADEPTGNLDSKSAKDTMRLIQRISKKKRQTVIMVTHDDHLAQYADRIFRILDGKLTSVEFGQDAYDPAKDSLYTKN